MAREGGPFTCSTTGFATEDVDEWAEHCTKGEDKESHTMHGTTVCLDCGVELRYRHYPFIPFEKATGHLKHPVQLRCDKCNGDDMNPRAVKVDRMDKRRGDTQTT